MRLEPQNIVPSPDFISQHLEIVGRIITVRLPPGSGEVDRVAHVRKLLDVSAELHYAISTYMHRVLAFAGRRPADGDLRDETAALQDALDGFSAQVHVMADTYRAFADSSAPVLDVAPLARSPFSTTRPSA